MVEWIPGAPLGIPGCGSADKLGSREGEMRGIGLNGSVLVSLAGRSSELEGSWH